MSTTPQTHGAYQQSAVPRSSSLPFPYLMGLSQSKPTQSPAINLKRAFARRKKTGPPSTQVIDDNVPQPPPPPPTKDTNRHSIIPLSPGISSAVNYIAMYDQSPTKETIPDKDKEKDKKDAWRKSDSTNSHHTVRPHRTSRPVSWAESFQSAHTVVQQPAGRPLSALIADADFGMPEEGSDDDDDSDAVPRSRAHDAVADRDPNTHDPHPPTHTRAPPSSFPSHPSSPEHRRSMSLDLLSSPGTSLPPPPVGTETRHRPPSLSISEGVPLSHPRGPPGIASSASSPAPQTTNPQYRQPPVQSAVGMHNARIFPALPASNISLGGAQDQAQQQPRRVQNATPAASQPLQPLRPTLSHHQGQGQQQQHQQQASYSSSASASSSSSFSFSSTSSLSSPGPAAPRIPTTVNANANTHPPSSFFGGPSSHHPAGVTQSSSQSQSQSQSQSPYPHPHPHPPTQPYTRTQTTSISGLGPAAAGLAKRAVEGLKLGMGRKWGMGMGLASPGGASGDERERDGAGRSTKDTEGTRDRERDRDRDAEGYSSSSSGAPSGSGAASVASSAFAFAFGKSKSASSANSHAHSGAGAHPGAYGYTHGSGLARTSSGSSAGHAYPHPHPHPQGQGQGQGQAQGPSHVYSKSHGHAQMLSSHTQQQQQRERGGSSVSSASASGRSSHDGSSYHSAAASSSNAASNYQQQQQQEREGPMLGRKLRGALVGAGGAGARPGGVRGLVFKRDLAGCVKDTGVWVGRGREGVLSAGVGRDGVEKEKETENVNGEKENQSKGEKEKEKEKEKTRTLIRELEGRRLPALVVRCAQHLLVWGVLEEGLFRVSGMPQHVAKLRAEFDAGCDYDMTECTPGDLDPHAVASVFKAYLRELPEPILTQKLQPHFDAAVSKETSINSSAAAAASGASISAAAGAASAGAGAGAAIGTGPTPTAPRRMSVLAGRGLPANPKSIMSTHPPTQPTTPGATLLAHTLRKPPSLSTLAAPSFTGIPPPSRALVLAIRQLVALLPQENRDILRTVVELIRATAERSKETKMPLSNLMLVFCPSLGMTPPLMKVLCEARGIWGDEEAAKEEAKEEEEEEDVMDIRRRTVVPASTAAAVAAHVDTNNAEGADDVPPPTPSKDNPMPIRRDNADAKSTSSAADTESLVSLRSGGEHEHDRGSDYHASAEAGEEGDDAPESMSSSLVSGQGQVQAQVPGQMPAQVQGQAQVQARKPLSTTPSVRNRRRRQVVSPVSARASEVPTVSSVYLDSRSCAASLSSQSSVSSVYEEEEEEDDQDGHGGGERNVYSPPPPPPLSASAESIATRTSSGNPSFSQLEQAVDAGVGVGLKDANVMQPRIADMTSGNTSMHSLASSGVPSASANRNNGSGRPVQFPSAEVAHSPYHYFPPPPSPTASMPAVATSVATSKNKTKRRSMSIPALSLPSFSPSIAPLFPNPSPAGSASGSSPHSAGSASASSSFGGQQDKQKQERSLLRSKKPSLKLLFSKRSASSLTGLGAGVRDGNGAVGISAPVPLAQGQQQQQPYPAAASAMFAYKHSPRSASESSVSTPLSAVTAPQSSLRSISGGAPVLDTPIEGGELGLDYGMKIRESGTEKEKVGVVAPAAAAASPGQSEDRPLARVEPPLRTTAQKRPVVGRGTLRSAQSTSASASASTTTTTTATNQVYQLRPQASSSNLSVSSTASSHHLSLFEDEDEDMEDWTQSVLLAADVDGNWAIQKPAASS